MADLTTTQLDRLAFSSYSSVRIEIGTSAGQLGFTTGPDGLVWLTVNSGRPGSPSVTLIAVGPSGSRHVLALLADCASIVGRDSDAAVDLFLIPMVGGPGYMFKGASVFDADVDPGQSIAPQARHYGMTS